MAEKWKAEIKSPGDAWMDHVEKHHGASEATPAYLKPQEKTQAISAIEQRMADLEKQVNTPEKEKQQEQVKEKSKDVDQSR